MTSVTQCRLFTREHWCRPCLYIMSTHVATLCDACLATLMTSLWLQLLSSLRLHLCRVLGHNLWFLLVNTYAMYKESSPAENLNPQCLRRFLSFAHFHLLLHSDRNPPTLDTGEHIDERHVFSVTCYGTQWHVRRAKKNPQISSNFKS